MSMLHLPRICMGFESLSLARGGIARVARLTAKVLSQEIKAGRMDARCLVLSDQKSTSEFDFPVRIAKGSQARFVYEINKACFSHTHFIYDFVGMARAHGKLPFVKHPFLSWILGIEVWENTMPHRIKWARRADFMISISHYTRERAESVHGGFTRAKVCWLATETDKPHTILHKRYGPPTVLIMSRLDEGGGYKGHAELIDCWPKVLSCIPDARLVIAGSGPGRDFLKKKAAASPSGHRIEFCGFVPQEQIEQLFRDATVFAMPSRGEGFGLVYIEAMRCGLPVIASIHDAAQEINLDGQTGFNVDLDKSDELPDRLIYLLNNPDQATRMGQMGKKRWFENFRYSVFKDRFLPILNEFLETS